MSYNHQLKNVEADEPGFLIDKFASSGRVILTVYTDVFSHKISFKLKSNTKDLEHLLKPATSFRQISADTVIDESTENLLFPMSFPDGFIESITLISNDYDKIVSFELACYGNKTNTLTDARQWFYVSSESMDYDGNCSYRFRNDDYRPIVPYSYNFVAVNLKLKNGGKVLSKSVDEIVSSRLVELEYQWASTFSMATTTTIPADLEKSSINAIPYIQFNILKAS